MVGVAGFEPATLWSQTRCATRLRYTPKHLLIQYLFIFSMYKDVQNKGFLIRICYIEYMIIVCPSCQKKFEVDPTLIPKKGKLLQCGSCNQTWFFNKDNQINIEKEKVSQNEITSKNKKIQTKTFKKKKEILDKDFTNLANIKGSELVKYEPKFHFTFTKFLNYFIVLIISFVALIIILDTFKSPLSTFFPNIELILYNLFETLKDLILFIKDLK